MWEKLLMPIVGTLLFLLMSAGFMFGAGGATARMRIVLRAATIFMMVMLHSMAWHKEIGRIFRWQDAWVATTIAGAVASVLLAKRWFAKRERYSEFKNML
jgi:hypothetical protein